MNRWTGESQLRLTQPANLLISLTTDPGWVALVQASEKLQYSGVRVPYGIEKTKPEDWVILPSVYITTDDCGCCS